MTAARIVTMYVHAYCEKQWPGEGPSEGARMASAVLNGSFVDVFDHKSHGSHKYIPADKLTADLGERQGAGVYGYWKMHDDSYVLLTCNGRLAYWSGKEEDKAEWGT